MGEAGRARGRGGACARAGKREKMAADYSRFAKGRHLTNGAIGGNELGWTVQTGPIELGATAHPPFFLRSSRCAVWCSRPADAPPLVPPRSSLRLSSPCRRRRSLPARWPSALVRDASAPSPAGAPAGVRGTRVRSGALTAPPRRSGHHLLVRGRLAARPCGDHRQRDCARPLPSPAAAPAVRGSCADAG